MSVLKIQISLPDLINLLGGDDAAVLELRRSVVEAFARTHINSLLRSDWAAALSARCQEVYRQHVSEALEKEGATLTRIFTGGVDLSASVKERIRLEVRNALSSEIKESVRLATVHLPSMVLNSIQAEVDKQVTAYTAERIKSAVDKRIEAFLRAANQAQ